MRLMGFGVWWTASIGHRFVGWFGLIYFHPPPASTDFETEGAESDTMSAAPLGPQSFEHPYGGRGPLLMGVTWTMAAIAIILTALRTYTNAIIVKRFSWDYYWAILTLVRGQGIFNASRRSKHALMIGADRSRRLSDSRFRPLRLPQGWEITLACSTIDSKWPP